MFFRRIVLNCIPNKMFNWGWGGRYISGARRTENLFLLKAVVFLH